MREKPNRKNAVSAPWFLGGFKSFIPLLNTERGIAFSLVFVAIVFNAVFLWSEVAAPTFSFNDEMIHRTATQQASSVLHQGLDPTDFWSRLELGYPLFHYYQNLPHLVLSGIDQLTSFFLPLPRLLDISRYLFLVLFPLSVFYAMRRFDFDHMAAGFSAVIASLLSTYGLYGFNYGSYVWWGFGLYTQLWEMFFLPLALAEIYRTIRREGSWFRPVFLSAIVLLSNLLYGFILVVSAAMFLFLKLDKAEIFSRFKKLAIICILTGLVTCYYYIPLILDRSYFISSRWLEAFKYNSFGASAVLTSLITGNLLDYGRIPILTMLFFLAAFFVIREWRKENCRLVLVVTIVWLLAYFGRPTWGPLLDMIPFTQNLLFHRFIGGFHLGAILLSGAGLSLFFHWVKKFSVKGFSFKNPLLVGITFLLILTPAFLGQALFYQENTHWKTESHNTFLSKSSEISGIKETLENLPPGRVYAGFQSDFGNYPYYTIGSVPLYFVLPQLGIDTFGYGSGPSLSYDIRAWFDNTKPEQYNLFNIRYVLLHRTWTPARYYSKVKEFDDYILYQVPTTGYFDLVDAPAVFYGNTTGFYSPNVKWLSSSLPKLKQHPIIELGDRPESAHGLPVYSFQEVDEKILSNLIRAQPAGGEIFRENVSTNEYRAQFVANRECYLLLKTNYHPGWRVVLDDKDVPPVMLAPGFIGIRVDPGTHQVLFSYHPPFYRFPLLVAGVLVLIILGSLQLKIPREIFKRIGGCIRARCHFIPYPNQR